MAIVPTWIQTILRSGSALTSFEEWVDSNITRCNNAYDDYVKKDDFTGIKTVYAEKKAYEKMKSTVNMYRLQETEDARIRKG